MDNVSVPIYFLFIYLVLIPIINLIRQNHSEVKIGFWKSYKYVFQFKAIKEKENGILNHLIHLISVALVIGVGVLSGFFMSSWCLWLILPPGSAICYNFIKRTIGKDTSINTPITLLLPAVLSLGFIIVQHIATNHVILTCVAYLLFLVWAVVSAIKHKEMPIVRKITYGVTLFVLCALILPTLYLGYSPLSKDFKYVARNWNQPKINSSITVPLIAFHNVDGLNGLADRHQIIFDANFRDIDSVSYEFFDWDRLKVLWDYNLLSKYYDDETVQNSSDLILYTKTGTLRWKDVFSSRGNSLYLTTRIKTIEKTPCSKWTEEEFRNIAELSAGYRITGCDSLANSLEALYFLRRMIQAEIYQCVDYSFTTDESTCVDMLDYYSQKKENQNFKGDYTASFIQNADTCISLKRRINSYLDVVGGGFIYSSLMDLAKIDTKNYIRLLNSYKNDIIPIKWVQEQLGNSVDMLCQTRDNIGSYVVDSLFTALYENEFNDDVFYNNSSAWYNLFLCRFADAEKYARRAIECAKEEYITENTTKYITFTNLITSLFLQGKTTESFDLIRKMKDFSIGGEDGDWGQLLFPIQATGSNVSVGEGVCQDFNHFLKIGVLNDTTTTEFRKLRKLLSFEYSLVSDQGHFVYPNGWNLNMIADRLYLFYKDEQVRLPLIKSYDINIKDSIAICQMYAGGYRFLDLSKMQFVGETYDYVWHFSERLAAVEYDGKIGFVNRQGQMVISPQYPTEKWLHNDHYRLSFHAGKTAVMEPTGYYNLIDQNGNWIWDGYHFPYVKWYGIGMVVRQRLKDNYWVCTDSDGIIQNTFDEELDGLLINPVSKSYIPIYNHFDVSGIKHADDLPELEISGIWYCSKEKSFVYFGKNNSQYMWIGKRNDSGDYFLSIEKKSSENNT